MECKKSDRSGTIGSEKIGSVCNKQTCNREKKWSVSKIVSKALIH